MRRHVSAFVTILFLHVAVLEAQPVTFCAQKTPGERQFVLRITPYDWGPAADKIVLCFEEEILPEQLKKEDFSVTVKFTLREFLGISLKKNVVQREVARAYSCDKDGNPVAGRSRYAALELTVTPENADENPFSRYPELLEWSYTKRYAVGNESLYFYSEDCAGFVCPEAAQFTYSKGGSGKSALTYAFWNPPQTRPGTPLIVWFHGIAEGGTDPSIALLGTKTTNLASPQIQGHFPDGASVLVIQTPVCWLVTNKRDITGLRLWVPADYETYLKRFLLADDSYNGAPESTVSYYTATAKKIIDTFLAENPFIDRKRIYVGGCSAGGYMTLNMYLQYTDFFAAAFPTCGAYPDDRLTDSQIQMLAKKPLWFTHALSDKTITVEKHDGATFRRLQEAGARNAHFVLFDDVHDLSGRFKDEDGSPFVFDGHSSWIYVLNDQSIDGNQSLFEWLSAQALPD